MAEHQLASSCVRHGSGVTRGITNLQLPKIERMIGFTDRFECSPMKITNGYSVEGVALAAGNKLWRGEYTLRERPPGTGVHHGKADGVFPSEMDATNAAVVAGNAHAKRLTRPRGNFRWGS